MIVCVESHAKKHERERERTGSDYSEVVLVAFPWSESRSSLSK